MKLIAIIGVAGLGLATANLQNHDDGHIHHQGRPAPHHQNQDSRDVWEAKKELREDFHELKEDKQELLRDTIWRCTATNAKY